MATCTKCNGAVGPFRHRCAADEAMISSLQSRAESAEKRAEQAERERDEVRKNQNALAKESSLSHALLSKQLSESQAAVGVMVEALGTRAKDACPDNPRQHQFGCDRDGDVLTERCVRCGEPWTPDNCECCSCDARRKVANLPALITADLKRREALEKVATEAAEMPCEQYGRRACDLSSDNLCFSCLARRVRLSALSATGSAKGEKPYYLIERNDRGRAEWLAWRDRAAVEWVTDAHAADRYEWAVAAERDARIYRLTFPFVKVTEHLDIPAKGERQDAGKDKLAAVEKKGGV